MKTITWPYGTRLRAKVASDFCAGGIDIVTLIDEHGEGHLLIDSGQSRPAVGAECELVFTQGGRNGGYWQIEEAADVAR